MGSAAAAEPALRADEPAVYLNTVGYVPDSRKLATASANVDEFVVRDSSTGKLAMRGRASQIKSMPAVQPLYELDFSKVRGEGFYRIDFSGRSSAEFRVGTGVYNWPFYCAVRGMCLCRCGTKVSATHGADHFEHAPCHLDDAYLDFVGGPVGKQKDATGGWHDAGDYNKYTVNAAFTLGMMLSAWEHFQQKLTTLKLDIPESGNQTPDFLDEARWELDWLLKMQADDGSVYHKVCTKSFGAFVLPEGDKERRYFSPWSSSATASFAAIMAQASRVYQPFDQEFSVRCLAAAKTSYAFLQTHPDDHRPDLSAFQIRPYVARDSDDRFWAAAELWATTGDVTALRDCEKRLGAQRSRSGASSLTIDVDWDWSNLRNLGTFTYLRSKRAGRDPAIVTRVRDDVLRVADGIVESAAQHPYGRQLGNRYYWGCNGTVARQTMNLNVAYELTSDVRYREAMLAALNHLFGRNPYGRSYVTGLGAHPPLYPHDRRSGADKVQAPWPGYLVGGPWPGPNDWLDSQDSYKTNEIAINWNGALIYALAVFVEPDRFAESVRSESKRANAHSSEKR